MDIVWGIKGTLHSACGTQSKEVQEGDVWKDVTLSGPNIGLQGRSEVTIIKNGTIFNRIFPDWYLIQN